MIGIGLGSFMEGFQGGIRAREAIDTQREKRDNRKALKAIDADARKVFDQKVAAGEAQPDDFGSFWREYALPKRVNQMLAQGDVEGARAFQEWGESEAVVKGGKLFSSALLKAQTGDNAGALQDAIEAGRVKGYIEHGYELEGQTELKDAQGNVIGFRLSVKGPDGKVVEQDVANGDMPRVIATFANPDAAWQSYVTKKAAEEARTAEMADYRKKKEIDKEFGIGTDKPKDPAQRYQEVYEELAKGLDWQDLTEEQRDAAVKKQLAAQDAYSAGVKGGGSAPAPAAQLRGVVVDTTTGQAMPGIAPAGPEAGASTSPSGIERRPLAPPAPPERTPGNAAAARQAGAAAAALIPPGTKKTPPAPERGQYSGVQHYARDGEDEDRKKRLRAQAGR